MTNSKRGTAVTGDLFTLEHRALDLSAPFTSHVDVLFDGITHQVLTTADHNAFNYAGATGSFILGNDEEPSFEGHIIESIDQVRTQAVHRYQAVLRAPTGALSTGTYLSSNECLRLVGALRPTMTPLGCMIDPTDEATIASAPKVALNSPIGVIEISPLETEVIDTLPAWAGTSVAAGELFGGRSAAHPTTGEATADDATAGDAATGDPATTDHFWLTLVTETARVVIMAAEGVDRDRAATVAASLSASWQA